MLAPQRAFPPTTLEAEPSQGCPASPHHACTPTRGGSISGHQPRAEASQLLKRGKEKRRGHNRDSREGDHPDPWPRWERNLGTVRIHNPPPQVLGRPWGLLSGHLSGGTRPQGSCLPDKQDGHFLRARGPRIRWDGFQGGGWTPESREDGVWVRGLSAGLQQGCPRKEGSLRCQH